MKNIHSLISYLLLSIITVLVIYFYYIYYPIHGVTKESDFFLYIIAVGAIYGIYKLIVSLLDIENFTVKPSFLLWAFFIQLLILCCFFFGFSGLSVGSGFILFFKIVGILFCISLFWIISSCLGSFILKNIPYFIINNTSLHILGSIGIGFFITMISIFILGSLSLYNTWSICILLGIFGILSYKEIVSFLKILFSPVRTYELQSSSGNIRLIIDEVLYLIITFFISVNLISVYRPFPIGWDDLGVYMNFPKLLSSAGEMISLGGMYTWQLYTGIGFLAGSQTYAFYMNTFSGIIVSIIIYLAIKVLVTERKPSFDFGLLAVVMILMMPMTVFQLAKDMKLDYGLLSMSVIMLTLLYRLLTDTKSFHHILGAYLLVGITAGLAFSIKFTSLLLLIGGLGTIFYSKLGLTGIIGYFSIFVGVFTGLDLWSYLSVSISNVSDIVIYTFSIISIFIGVGLLIFTSAKNILKLKESLVYSFIIIVGFVVSISPWIVKNLGEIENFGIGGVISGNAERYTPEYSDIYSEEELSQIQVAQSRGITQEGTTTNEDLGRFFGYEKGINNYLKLPWNLTMQTNQKGEFTEISYIYLVLLPLIFLFLPYKKPIYRYFVAGFVGLFLIYVIQSPISTSLTNIVGNIVLPYGYFVIVLLFFLPLIFFYYTLKEDYADRKLFLINYSFSVIYVFLWAIAAFGIVWYGILMYFVFILMILLTIISFESSDENNTYFLRYIVLGIVSSYLLFSALPHGINNLKAASYPEYKLGMFSEEASLMRLHPDYFTILWELNISDESKPEIIEKYKNELLNFVSQNEELSGLSNIIPSISTNIELKNVLAQLEQNTNGVLLRDIQSIQQSLYEDIIYPEKEIQNTKNIYRVGTFLKYFIADNNSRLLDDSLLTSFDIYLYDEEADTIINRMNTLDIQYILLDLNAATIDQDARKALTNRYENILRYSKLGNLEIIETDSICLRLARDLYQRDGSMEEFLIIAGTNYDDLENSRGQKRYACANLIAQILQNEESASLYPYLAGFGRYFEANNIDTSNIEVLSQQIARILPIGFKVLFKVPESE